MWTKKAPTPFRQPMPDSPVAKVVKKNGMANRRRLFNNAARRGVSYRKRVADVNRIYDEHAKRGLSNREIWRRYIYPVYGITERTFYNLLNAPASPRNELPPEYDLFFAAEDGKGDK